MEVRVRVPLVQLEVARRVERDRRDAGAVAVEAQRDLLRHRPARHQHGGGLPEQVGDPLLEPLHEVPFAVVVGQRPVVDGVGGSA